MICVLETRLAEFTLIEGEGSGEIFSPGKKEEKNRN